MEKRTLLLQRVCHGEHRQTGELENEQTTQVNTR
jgi:hypothetical protein